MGPPKLPLGSAAMIRKWWTLAGACSGLFLLMLDSTVVALALPEIRGDVGASSEGLQWVMNGYLLTIAVLVVTAGRLGDMFGRKRVFLVGMVVFAAGSVVSGAAGDQVALIAGRVLQGVGAAPMLSLSLALVCNAFPVEEQPRALGIWAAVSAVALAIGPLAGGLLIELDWRVIFWMNLPVAAIGIAITAIAAPESTDPGAGTRIDWAGLAALSVGITAAVLALVQSNAWAAELHDRPGAGGGRRAARLLARRAPGAASRSSTSPSSATGPTSAPAPPPSPWSAPTGR